MNKKNLLFFVSSITCIVSLVSTQVKAMECEQQQIQQQNVLIKYLTQEQQQKLHAQEEIFKQKLSFEQQKELFSMCKGYLDSNTFHLIQTMHNQKIDPVFIVNQQKTPLSIELFLHNIFCWILSIANNTIECTITDIPYLAQMSVIVLSQKIDANPYFMSAARNTYYAFQGKSKSAQKKINYFENELREIQKQVPCITESFIYNAKSKYEETIKKGLNVKRNHHNIEEEEGFSTDDSSNSICEKSEKKIQL
jgi:hypothetical protein